MLGNSKSKKFAFRGRWEKILIKINWFLSLLLKIIKKYVKLNSIRKTFQQLLAYLRFYRKKHDLHTHTNKHRNDLPGNQVTTRFAIELF